MRETHTAGEPEQEPYFQDDVEIGPGRFFRETYTIRLKVHTSSERSGRDELLPGVHLSGDRMYIHAHPYILVPDVAVTVDLHPRPTPEGEIGTVAGSDWVGMRHLPVGNAQAWHYPEAGTVVLWECYPHPAHRAGEPRADDTRTTLWRGFERYLIERLPGIERLVTPAWDPDYDRGEWQVFLQSLGYRPLNEAVFEKSVGGDADIARATG